jgi:methylmalonyl-CoA mutase N-terminal domain/subunit
VDPFAGSYAVEAMTDDIEAAAIELMAKIDEMGGALAAIERGFQKSEIERSAYEVARQTDDGRRVVVGVNKFTIDEEEPYEPLRVDPGIADTQAEQLRELRAGRDQMAVSKAVGAVKSAAAGTDNVLPPIRDAVRAGATLGEVCDALRAVWGTYRPPDAG